MKKFYLRAFVAIAVACSLWCFNSLNAYADQVNLTFTGTGINTAAGGADYAYPYYFTVGAQTNVPLMCISFYNTITQGESWTADVVSAATSTQYEEAAWLLNDAIINPQNITKDQDAAWFLFANAPLTSDGANNPQLLAAQSFATDPTFNAARFQIYIPATWEGTKPQTFVGVTPEPGNLLLLGSGLALLAFGIFRSKITA